MHTEESREVAAQLLQLAPLFGREVYGGGPRERCGLSLCQLQALGWVQREPGMNMTALADRLGISRQQLSRTADLLVERGLIERYPHPSNRREILLRPSPKAGQLRETMIAALSDRLGERLEALSVADLQILEEGCELLRRVLMPEQSGTPKKECALQQKPSDCGSREEWAKREEKER